MGTNSKTGNLTRQVTTRRRVTSVMQRTSVRWVTTTQITITSERRVTTIQITSVRRVTTTTQITTLRHTTSVRRLNTTTQITTLGQITSVRRVTTQKAARELCGLIGLNAPRRRRQFIAHDFPDTPSQLTVCFSHFCLAGEKKKITETLSGLSFLHWV